MDFLNDYEQEKLLTLTTTVSKAFPLEHQYFQRFVAINFYRYNKEFKADVIKGLIKYIKSKTKLLSPFRSNIFLFASLLSCTKDNPQKTFNEILGYYDLLVDAGFKKNQFLPMTAYCLHTSDPISNVNNLLSKAKEIYTTMKKNHPFITGGDDYPLSVLIAQSNKNIERIEYIYTKLNEQGFTKGNDLQGLSHILSLGDESEDILIDRCVQMKDESKVKGLKIRINMYTGLGLLVLLNNPSSITDVVQLTDILKHMPKYKWMDKNFHFMFAVAIYSGKIQSLISNQAVVLEATYSVVIEQIIAAQMAVMVAVIASTSAAASAGS